MDDKEIPVGPAKLKIHVKDGIASVGVEMTADQLVDQLAALIPGDSTAEHAALGLVRAFLKTL